MLNPLLEDLNGLGNLAIIAFGVLISNNQSLISLAGLSNVTSAPEYIYIMYNNALPSLEGLDNIADSAIYRLEITGNDTLSDCAVESICHFLADPVGLVDISDNETGCNDAVEILEACETLSTDDLSQDADILIYPNPVSTHLTIILPNAPLMNTILNIYNINGQQLLSRQVTEQMTVVDISGLRGGIYAVRVMDKKGVIVGKFLKR